MGAQKHEAYVTLKGTTRRKKRGARKGSRPLAPSPPVAALKFEGGCRITKALVKCQRGNSVVDERELEHDNYHNPDRGGTTWPRKRA